MEESFQSLTVKHLTLGEVSGANVGAKEGTIGISGSNIIIFFDGKWQIVDISGGNYFSN